MNATADTAAPADPQADAAYFARADQLDAQAAPADIDPATGQPAAPVDYQGEAAMLLELAVTTAGTFWPCVPTIWTKDKRAAVAEAAAPVMAKYGFTMGDFFGAYKEEIGLLFVAAPLVLQTVDAIKADKLKPKDKPAGQGDAPDSQTDADPFAPAP